MSDIQLNRPCPYCGLPLFLDAGEPQTREHPGSPPRAYCFDCGVDFEPTEDDLKLLWGEGADSEPEGER